MLLVLYLLALHGGVLALVVKTDFLVRAGKTLGWLPPEEFTPGFYRAALDQAARAAALAAPPPVVLLGDSIVAALDPAQVAPGAADFGLGGETTRTLLARLGTLRPAMGARAVLGVGVNDLKYRDPPQIAADYAKLLAALPPVVALAPLPVDAAAARGRPYLREARIAALDAAVQAACAARPGCVFVDAGDAALHGPDGWHLSPAGSAAVAARLARALP